MPKTQTDLSSFFSGGPAKKKKNPQTKLDTFFGGKKKADRENVAGEDEKENNLNKRTLEAADNEDEKKADGNNKKNATKIGNKKSKVVAVDPKRLRRVIDEDSSDEEMEEQDAETKETTDSDKIRVKKSAVRPAKICQKGPKEHETEGEEDTQSDDTEDMQVDKEETKADKEKEKKASTEITISAKEASTPPKELPVESADLTYGDICEAFEKIEAITGRLEIQQIMTNLFRKQLTSGRLDNLYPMMYLCSNTVAPAYECVELGVGDAILIKAIAEAYGTNPEQVKLRYDDLGDLGDAAQSFKGKQKTLGGFFTTKTKAKPLSCNEVLKTFREIAETKGNQAQKWKTEKIKKMLVRAMSPAETSEFLETAIHVYIFALY